MKIIFDENLSSQREIEVTMCNEHLYEHRLMASHSFTIEEDSVFPDLSLFTNDQSFTTIKLLNKNNVPINLSNEYNTILSVNINYYEDANQYQINIAIGYIEPNNIGE